MTGFRVYLYLVSEWPHQARKSKQSLAEQSKLICYGNFQTSEELKLLEMQRFCFEFVTDLLLQLFHVSTKELAFDQILVIFSHPLHKVTVPLNHPCAKFYLYKSRLKTDTDRAGKLLRDYERSTGHSQWTRDELNAPIGPEDTKGRNFQVRGKRWKPGENRAPL